MWCVARLKSSRHIEDLQDSLHARDELDLLDAASALELRRRLLSRVNPQDALGQRVHERLADLTDAEPFLVGRTAVPPQGRGGGLEAGAPRPARPLRLLFF